MTDDRIIATWLNDLATLTAGRAPLVDAKAKIAALADMLAGEFAPEAFTKASLAAVAKRCKFFPAYAELHKVLRAWCNDNTPRVSPPRLVHDQFADEERDRRERADGWRNITAEEVQRKVRLLDGHPGRIAWGIDLAAKLAALAPHHLAWLPPEFLTGLARPIAERILPNRIPKPADPLHTVDEQKSAFEARTSRKSGELTSDQLGEFRKAGNIPIAVPAD